MRHLMCLAGILLFCSQYAISGIAPDDVCLFGLLRTWAADRNGPDRGEGDTAAGVTGHPEISPADPLYKELAARFSRTSGLMFEEKPPPVPNGKLVWWDIDRDGAPDLVFAGGASPDPYCVIMKTASGTWRVWQEMKGRLLAIVHRDGRVIMIAAFDSYGVSRDRGLRIKACDPRAQGPCREAVFRWAGTLEGLAAKGAATACTAVRATGLRTSPKVDRAPCDSGMGFEWPGNLFQELARGSSGWLLDTRRNPGGEQWSLAVFPDTLAEADNENLLKAITTPRKASRPSGTLCSPDTRLMVGWVRTRDLVLR